MFLLQVNPVGRHLGQTWVSPKKSVRIALLTVAITGVWFGLLHSDLHNTRIFEHVRGGTADWLVVKEAVSGADAYAPVPELARKYLDWHDVKPDSPHPWPPSALLLLSPLSLVSPRTDLLCPHGDFGLCACLLGAIVREMA